MKKIKNGVCYLSLTRKYHILTVYEIIGIYTFMYDKLSKEQIEHKIFENVRNIITIVGDDATTFFTAYQLRKVHNKISKNVVAINKAYIKNKLNEDFLLKKLLFEPSMYIFRTFSDDEKMLRNRLCCKEEIYSARIALCKTVGSYLSYYESLGIISKDFLENARFMSFMYWKRSLS